MNFLPGLVKGAWDVVKGIGSWIGNKVGSVLSSDTGRTAVNAGIGYYNAKKQRELQERTNRQNFDFQREVAQNGVQWRVNDAKKAGISPLYGLGASLGSGMPSAQTPDSPNIPKLPKKYRIAMEALQMEAAKLDNEVKRATILEIQSQAKRNEADIVFQQKQLSDLTLERSKITGAGKPRTISPFGYDIEVPAGSSANDISDEYGDIAEDLYGLARLGQTAVHHAKKIILDVPIYRGSRDHRSTRPIRQKVRLY